MSPRPVGVDLFLYERELREKGHRFVVGIDEAGRGPLAGPVVAAAVIFDLEALPSLPGVYDSKALTPRQRFVLYEKIHECALAIGVGSVENTEIDRINIYRATQKAMLQALQQAKFPYDGVLIDAMPLSLSCPVFPLVKGDQRSFVIAAASIIAKVERDKIMDMLHEEYPVYGWKNNRGYPTKTHREAIVRYGLSPYHRRSFDCYGKSIQDKCPPDKTHAGSRDTVSQIPPGGEDNW
ncbi:MAG: ribonuclease HII [Brevinematales bacterium]|nr:ribonuclease HII [Brevinematales bacterium]